MFDWCCFEKRKQVFILFVFHEEWDLITSSIKLFGEKILFSTQLTSNLKFSAELSLGKIFECFSTALIVFLDSFLRCMQFLLMQFNFFVLLTCFSPIFCAVYALNSTFNAICRLSLQGLKLIT